MGIADADIATVRDRAGIVDVIAQHVQLRRTGRRWKGLCPFHAEKTPSFSVNQEQGLYFCFGCGAKGDVITFVREVHRLDFVAAVELLAARVGVSLTYDDPAEGESRRRRRLLAEAVERAAGWHHERLLHADDAAPARAYLRGRGIDGDLVRRFRLGWAPEDRWSLVEALGVPDDVLVDAGLAFRRQDRMFDAFHARIMFPIIDASGVAVGFGARVLPGVDGAKYKNSADSDLYQKSRVLYGLDLAKASIVGRDRVVVCEGYTDVIGLAKAGVSEAVATCGTALTEDHVRLLAAYSRRVVLAFDADEAGQEAVAKVHQWEVSHRLDVRVVSLPAGTDPGGLAESDPEGLRAAVEQAKPLLGWRVGRVLADVDPTPEGKARAVQDALTLIGQHPDRLVRDQYTDLLADRLGLDRRQVAAAGSGRPIPERPVVKPVEVVRGVEAETIRCLLDDPDAMMGERVRGHLFADPRARAVFDAWEDTGESTVAALSAVVCDVAGEWLWQVAAEDSDAEAGDVVRLLWRAAVGRWLADGVVPVEDVGRLKLWVEELDGPEGEAALEELDTWATLSLPIRPDVY